LGAKKDRGTGFSVFLPREKWDESQKTKEGGRGGEGHHFCAGKTNPTETLATQAG